MATLRSSLVYRQVFVVVVRGRVDRGGESEWMHENERGEFLNGFIYGHVHS